MMNIFLDTNVILDFLIQREPFFDDANKIIQVCLRNKASVFIAAHSVLNIDYIIKKLYSKEERKALLKFALDLFEVVDIDKNKLRNALNDDSFSDFEDCVQFECSKQICADYIITRNKKDFVNPLIPILEPKEFLSLHDV